MFSDRDKRNQDEEKRTAAKRTTSAYPVTQLQSFLDYVQLHERTWGTETYPKRPSLAEIMAAPVVAFWYTSSEDDPFKITLHQDTAEVEKHILRLILGSRYNPPQERLAQVFKHQKRLSIANVKIEFRETE